jgi:3-phosphoglycerate kinase
VFLSIVVGCLVEQDELSHVKEVLEPKRPFVAVVAGAKYDTKIGPLTEIYKKVDRLVLGGIIYNTFLCAKYDIKIKGVGVCYNFILVSQTSSEFNQEIMHK